MAILETGGTIEVEIVGTGPEGASAYRQAVRGGYTGTEAQFNEDLAGFKNYAASAAASATAAAGSAANAGASAEEAEASADDAIAAKTAAGEASYRAQEAQTAALTAKAQAESASVSAKQYRNEAYTAKTDAETAQAVAENAKAAAQTAQGAAETAQGAAEDAQEAAEDAKEAAAGSATQASAKAGEAAQSATAAAASAADAATAKTAAQSAQAAAETAQSAAEDAQEAAEDAQAAAEKYKINAETAKSAAQNAAVSAGYSQNAAEAAKGKAEAAQAAAEDAQAASETAQAAAEDAQTASETAQAAAEDAAESVSASAAQIETNRQDIAVLRADVDGKAPAITDSASGSRASFSDGAEGMPLKALTVRIDLVQAGSGDPGPDNVRPISGWTGCRISRCGDNLFDGATFNYSTDASGADIPGPTSRSTGLFPVPFDELQVNFTLNDGVTFPLNSGIRMIRYDANKVFVDRVIRSTESMLARPWPVSNCSYIKVQWFTSEVKQVDVIKRAGDPDGEAGDSDPYDWEDVAGTVYGGSLTINDDGTGTLTVDKGMFDMGTATWGAGGAASGKYGCTSVGNVKEPADTYTAADIQCEIYPAIAYHSSTGYGVKVLPDLAQIAVYDSEHTDFIAWMQYINGKKLVYALAEPITYQLTAQQVLATLYGTNNIWADCGDIEVIYRADTKLYIQRINAPADADMIADAAIADGKYFIIGGNLYKSTTTIPAGDSIIPGTNCTLTNLAEALNALNA